MPFVIFQNELLEKAAHFVVGKFVYSIIALFVSHYYIIYYKIAYIDEHAVPHCVAVEPEAVPIYAFYVCFADIDEKRHQLAQGCFPLRPYSGMMYQQGYCRFQYAVEEAVLGKHVEFTCEFLTAFGIILYSSCHVGFSS